MKSKNKSSGIYLLCIGTIFLVLVILIFIYIQTGKAKEVKLMMTIAIVEEVLSLNLYILSCFSFIRYHYEKKRLKGTKK